jgi:hypothetical protein
LGKGVLISWVGGQQFSVLRATAGTTALTKSVALAVGLALAVVAVESLVLMRVVAGVEEEPAAEETEDSGVLNGGVAFAGASEVVALRAAVAGSGHRST